MRIDQLEVKLSATEAQLVESVALSEAQAAEILDLQHAVAHAKEECALLKAELKAMDERAQSAEGRERVSMQKLVILNSQYTRMLATSGMMVGGPTAASA